ncbi:S1 family peptidase [Streptosporangium sp. NBC_01755]|uniref:S1 family peptidase n=1 Tax=unclassified Streptosporangium TaxID=2632669 RepID=UPI002DD8AA91|nr:MULTISPECIES: S1 family peptidase [unclassified Streptosporangium]WSA28163.1 S1 family peptidase [Streptosporangium sp. NBC_01810]WSD00361.1 S1 family peptidase [Streptosporangium sp. NBC_01755]
MSRRHIVTAGCVLTLTALTPSVIPAVVPVREAGAVAVLTAGKRKPPPDPIDRLPPGVIEALQRDFGLTRKQAETRLRNEARLTVVEAGLRDMLRDCFGGSWLMGTLSETLVVATTSTADIPRIVAAGAQPKIVTASLAKLRAIKQKLDESLPNHPTGGSVRYIDVKSNKVVVLSRYAAATRLLVASIPVDRSLVVVQPSTETPRPS